MGDQELELRAAKVLRLETWKSDYIVPMGAFPNTHTAVICDQLIPKHKLKFTISYDWSYLGLKECERIGNIGRADGQPNLILNQLWDIYDKLEENKILSPLELTKVWVPLLEKQKTI